MDIKKLLGILIPVCLLSVTSCTNEEYIQEASQSQRGRDFREAFHAHFGNIDPNHTWVDGTVGTVTVTTDQEANVVIYGLGLEDHTLLRLKQCIVNGTQEVKYDVPMGCKSVVLRAYNSQLNEYKTLDPSNENEEAIMIPGMNTRAGDTQSTTIHEFIQRNPPRARQLVPNVWNGYGKIAPWETSIPNVNGVEGQVTKSGTSWLWRFFYTIGNTKYNIECNTYTHSSDVWLCLIPTGMFSSDEEFCQATGFTSAQMNTEWQKVTISLNSNSRMTVTRTSGTQTTLVSNNRNRITTKDANNSDVDIPAGNYYNFKLYGKYGAWWKNRGRVTGQTYVVNMDITNSTTGSLKDAPDYFTMELNETVVNDITRIIGDADNDYNKLAPYVTDAPFRTLAPGPVAATWFYGSGWINSYIGYYYTVGEDTPEKRNAAARYLLLDAGSHQNTGSGSTSSTRQKGDTFPLTYYGEDGTGQPTYTFPAGVNIHFFTTQSSYGFRKMTPATERDAAKHPSCVASYNWPTSHSYQGDWLFYDQGNGGWTINMWYNCYSEGGDVNTQALRRMPHWETNGYHTNIDDVFHGNFKPCVAFNHAGYNIIGFEDNPSAGNLDWNDCIFMLHGNFNIKNYNEQALSFTMCMEDLGNTNDLDYNDLVMNVTQGYVSFDDYYAGHREYYSAPQVNILKAGGTLPLKVEFVSENSDYAHLNKVLFQDVHTAFGAAYSDVAINTFDPTVYNNGYFEGTYNDREVVSVTFEDGMIVKCVKGVPSVQTTWGTEFTTTDIASFSILENISSFKVYVYYENGEVICVSGPKSTTQAGTGTNNDDKIPYAFWFPQTIDRATTLPIAAERQFINDAVTGFNDWVANQQNKTKWYEFKWGE